MKVDVPQDILYKYLADNNHPDWNITLPASLEEYVELTKSNPLLKGILHTLVLDIEIYRQDISQDIFKLRIQQRRNKIAIWEQLVEDGLLLDFANTNNINVIVRGARNSTDFNYESQISQMNNSMDSALESIFFIATDPFKSITSSLVRQVIDLNGDYSKFISKDVANHLVKING